MDMKGVESSNIHSIGYDPETKKLHICFLKAGKAGPTWAYGDVTAEQHRKLLASKSKGQHFHKHILVAGIKGHLVR